ncbi:hypothetical protein [Rhodoferax sp.]|uniref:hypothetical protein n=1 Tax=Rhodoferax sp. TaxID=50421 RepID=UPI0025F61476|nr:hypothetical protein [Rhodoferax sp.]
MKTDVSPLQINTALSHLEHMTYWNSALVEESAATSQGLCNQVQYLAVLICHFVLPEKQGTDTPLNKASGG